MKNFFFLLAFLTILCTGVRAQQTPAVANTPDRVSIINDLDRTVAAMEKYHCNAYHYTTEEDVAALKDELAAGLPANPTRMDAYRALSQLTCAFGDGHTRVWDYGIEKDYRAAGGTYFPLAVTARAGQLTVSADYRADNTDLTGRQILAINGIPAKRLIAEMSVHASRETATLDLVLLSGNFARYLWLTYDWAAGDFELTFNDGSALTVTGLTKKEITANRPAPEDTPLITTEILDGNIAYLRIDHFEGSPKKFKQLFKEAFATINASGATQLILDLRNHGGGDSRVGNDLARYLASEPFRQFAYSEWKATADFKDAFKNAYFPSRLHWALPLVKGFNPHSKAIYSAADGESARVSYNLIKPYPAGRAFNGEVTMLMDNNTFSAGTCFAAMFKDYAMGTIVGQESGNLANFHADGLLKMGMQNGDLLLQISNSYLVRPSGDEAAVAVQPDVLLDPATDALEYALDMLRGNTETTAARK